jgi:hypothetical protein
MCLRVVFVMISSEAHVMFCIRSLRLCQSYLTFGTANGIWNAYEITGTISPASAVLWADLICDLMAHEPVKYAAGLIISGKI